MKLNMHITSLSAGVMDDKTPYASVTFVEGVVKKQNDPDRIVCGVPPAKARLLDDKGQPSLSLARKIFENYDLPCDVAVEVAIGSRKGEASFDIVDVFVLETTEKTPVSASGIKVAN